MEKSSGDKDILFSNTTKLNGSEVTAFQNHALKKYTLTISIVIAVFFSAIGIGLCFINTYLGAAIIVAGIVGGVILFPYLTKETIRKQNLEIFGDVDYINQFNFYEDKLEVINIDERSNKQASQEFDYQEIYKIEEFKLRLFIYINKNQSFIFDAKSMTKGTVGEVVDLFKSKGVKIVDKTNLPEPTDKNNKKTNKK